MPITTSGKGGGDLETRVYPNTPVADITSTAPEQSHAWRVLAALAVAAALATGLYGLLLRAWRKPPQDLPPTWDDAKPRHFAIGSIGGAPLPRLDHNTLNQLADLMGYFQSADPGRRLNVAASIQATIRSGGIPSAQFYTRKRIRSLLILEDALAGALAWNPIAAELADGMARRGMPVVYGRFRGSPDTFLTRDGATHLLDDFTDQRHGVVALVCTDGAAFARLDARRALETLSRWPMTAWLDLREPRFWECRADWLKNLRLPIYPATPDGIARALRRFLTEQAGAPDDAALVPPPLPNLADLPLPIYVEQLLGDALPWVQACALLQPCSRGLAERLRQRFYPDLPPERLERLYALPGTMPTLTGLRFSTEVQAVLRRGLLTRCTPAERQIIGQFILYCVADAQPTDADSPAYLAWEAAKERLRFEVEPDNDLQRLSALANMPLGAAISASFEGFALPELTPQPHKR